MKPSETCVVVLLSLLLLFLVSLNVTMALVFRYYYWDGLAS